MVFHCPNCHKAVLCFGLSNREFISIDENKKLKGVTLYPCPHCDSKVRLHLKGVITKAIPVLEEN